MILTTKSGTNEIHGSFFETPATIYSASPRPGRIPRTSRLRTWSATNSAARSAAPSLSPNSTTARTNRSSSSPTSASRCGRMPTSLYGPHRGHAKRRLQRTGQQRRCPAELSTIPTPRTANLQRQPFPNNQIPISRISPLAKTLYAATPLPTSRDNPLVNSNLNDINNTHRPSRISTSASTTSSTRTTASISALPISTVTAGSCATTRCSPANIEGGGLPAGATGYQPIPITTVSDALGSRMSFLPTFFSETILSQQWQSMYVEGNPTSTRTMKAARPARITSGSPVSPPSAAT